MVLQINIHSCKNADDLYSNLELFQLGSYVAFIKGTKCTDSQSCGVFARLPTLNVRNHEDCRASYN